LISLPKWGELQALATNIVQQFIKRMDIVMHFEAILTAIKIACAFPPFLKPGASTARGVW
jgi:hypothetical protein